jgi:hypothetical protein
MAQPWFSQLQDLVRPLVDELGDDVEIECTHFFSGAAVYVNGQICMSLTPVGFALKLPDLEREEVLAAGGQSLRYFPSGPIKKGYVVVPGEMFNNIAELTRQMKICIQFVAT